MQNKIASDKTFCKSIYTFFDNSLKEDDERDILHDVIEIKGQIIISIQSVGQHPDEDGKNKTLKEPLAMTLFSSLNSSAIKDTLSNIWL